MNDTHVQTKPAVHGLVAEFDDPDVLLEAAKMTYAEGYRNLDAYSSFPIHGLAEAIGYKKTWVPFFVLCGGLTGTATAFLMQYVARVIHYPYGIGGRADFAWPGFVPIMFELTILFAAFSALFSMLIINGLPRPYHSIFNATNFQRATTDGFFLCIEASDTKYEDGKTQSFLESLGAKAVSEVAE